jgi:hypothetical protein
MSFGAPRVDGMQTSSDEHHAAERDCIGCSTSSVRALHPSTKSPIRNTDATRRRAVSGEKVLRQLRPPPTRQNVTQKRIRIRARHTGRQIYQLAHHRVHPTSSTTANYAFRMRILQSDAPKTQVSHELVRSNNARSSTRWLT